MYQAEGPLYNIRDLNQLIEGKVELLEARKLQDTVWDHGKFIVLEIQLHHLSRQRGEIDIQVRERPGVHAEVRDLV